MADAVKKRMKDTLSTIILMLCKNELNFAHELSVEALVGITVDRKDVILININEVAKNTLDIENFSLPEKPNHEVKIISPKKSDIPGRRQTKNSVDARSKTKWPTNDQNYSKESEIEDESYSRETMLDMQITIDPIEPTKEEDQSSIEDIVREMKTEPQDNLVVEPAIELPECAMFGEGSSSGPYVCYGLPPDEQLQPSAENFSNNAGKTAWPCADFNYVSGTNMSSHGNENSFSTSGYSQSFKTKPSTSPRRKPQHKVRQKVEVERQFVCQKCDRQFHRLFDLNRHIQCVHQKNKMKCPYCQVVLGSQGSLQRHLRWQHGIQMTTRGIPKVILVTEPQEATNPLQDQPE